MGTKTKAEMTDDQRRIKIAEADGWTYIETLAFTGIPKGSRGNADARVIPDYLNSRDAIVEAILRRFKTDEEKTKLVDALMRLVDAGTDPVTPIIEVSFTFATATARQLAKAYLAAIK